MSEEQNKETVRRYYEAYNTGDVGAYEAMFASDYVMHGSASSVRPESGAKLHAQIVAGSRASGPDLQYKIDDLLADGDKVIARASATSTLQGELRTRWGIFPSAGKRITYTEISIHRFVDGKIAEQWWELDWVGVLTQVGALPGGAER